MGTITNSIMHSGQRPFVGPHLDGNDNLYVVAEDSNTADDLAVFKSTDDGATWTRQDISNQPNIGNGLASWSVFQVGTVLHIASSSELYPSGMADLGDIGYYTFNTSDAGSNPDTWQISEAVVSTTDPWTTGVEHCDIAVRSDGDVIIVHQGSAHTSMGSDYGAQAYSRREGGSWTTDVQVSEATASSFGVGRCVLGTSDAVHIIYWKQSVSLAGKTLDSSNNLSTVTDIPNFGSLPKTVRPISWDNSGTQQIVIAAERSVQRLEEDGSGNIAIESGQARAFASDTGSQHIALVYNSDTGFVHAYFDGADADLYSDFSNQGDDAGWGTDLEVVDAVTVNHNVSANIYTRDGGLVTGVVYYDTVLDDFVYTEVIAELTFFVDQATERDTAQDIVFGPDTGTSADLLGSLNGPTRETFYRDGSNVYAVQVETETAGNRSVPQILKSLDDGANWGYFDSHADNPNTTDRCDHISSVFDGTFIGVIWYAGDGEYAYSVYDTSQELWVREQEIVATDATASVDSGGTAIGIRPTSGEVVVAYVSETDYTISAKIRPDINGGTGWGTELSLHNTASVLHAPTLAIDSVNDDVHVCWVGDSTNDNLYHRRIDGATDALGTLQTSSVTALGSQQLPGYTVIYHGWLYHMWVDATPDLHVRRANIADVPTWTDATASTANIATVNAGDWIPASLLVGDDHLIATWVRDSDNTIMWGLGPVFSAEQATATTITDTYGYLASIAEATSGDLHTVGVQSDVLNTDVAATYRDLTIKQASGASDGSTYGDLEPVDKFQLKWGFGDKRFYDFITELPETSTHPRRFFIFRIRNVGAPLYVLDVWVSMDGFRWHDMEYQTDAESALDIPGYQFVDYDSDANLFHISLAHRSTDNTTTDGEVNYYQFNPDTEVWDVEKQSVISTIMFGVVNVQAALRSRPDGTVVCAYTNQSSGTFEHGYDYKIRSSGGTWGGASELVPIPTAETYTGLTALVGSSDRIHFFYFNVQNYTYLHRSLSSSDALDTENQIFDAVTTLLLRVAPCVLMNGTTIGVVYERDDRLRAFKTATSGANPTWSSQSNIDDSVFADMHVTDNNEAVQSLYVIGGEFKTAVIRGTRPNPLDLYKDEFDGSSWGIDEDTGLNTLAGIYEVYGNHAYTLDSVDYIMVAAEDVQDVLRIHHLPLDVEPSFDTELAVESNVAFDVEMSVPETTIVMDLAVESDVAFDVALSVDPLPLDASTTIILTLIVSDSDAVFGVPEPLKGLGKVERGDHSARIYQPNRIVTKR